MLPLTFVPKENHWILHRELLVGKYEYKYIVDGSWRTNHHEPLTRPNMDGHINNFVEVVAEFEDAKTKNLRRRVMQENPILNGVEHRIIHHNFFLHLLPSLFFKS
ncbi:hypothetical protein GOP47_0004622 [Adiantum capillus-veneris]|uniref:AMP-activated protein kinase glycogen-binding domain-containing protein n=1 Tax=Adiantum capillus-veneris TaxID=13818 RepID=A0A9D4V8F5_ADICA|nr:hypothetical protein GOP47_0004622 [Adiantum capillus-veneris]